MLYSAKFMHGSYVSAIFVKSHVHLNYHIEVKNNQNCKCVIFGIIFTLTIFLFEWLNIIEHSILHHLCLNEILKAVISSHLAFMFVLSVKHMKMQHYSPSA